MKFIPHDYQHNAIDYLTRKLAAAIFLDMGLG
jgi:hypothetical protein